MRRPPDGTRSRRPAGPARSGRGGCVASQAHRDRGATVNAKSAANRRNLRVPAEAGVVTIGGAQCSPSKRTSRSGEPGSGLARRRSGPGGPNRADEAEGVARLRERRDLDHVARVRRLDETAAADVHADVLRTAGARLEEDEVTRLERPRGNAPALVELRPGVVRQLDPELRVDVHDQAGTVEAGQR